jgi:predicted butyrate kinase (DUF1464 family)
MKDLHTPERLAGESLERYHHRLYVSGLVAKNGKLLKGHKASLSKQVRRKLTDAIGTRQMKKVLRKAREDHRAKVAADQDATRATSINPLITPNAY